MNFDTVSGLIAELTLLRFFPSEPNARLALVRMIGEMAHDENEVRWLVHRILALFNDWPGPLVIRQIFCSRFVPRDGMDVFSTLEYLDGVPPEHAIEAPAPLQLPDGHVASIDPELERAVRELAAAKDLNNPRSGHVHPVPVDTTSPPITEQDIENAVNENREKQALAEFKGDVQ
jgi:hypothetical protein